MTRSGSSSDPSMEEILHSIRQIIADEPDVPVNPKPYAGGDTGYDRFMSLVQDTSDTANGSGTNGAEISTSSTVDASKNGVSPDGSNMRDASHGGGATSQGPLPAGSAAGASEIETPSGPSLALGGLSEGPLGTPLQNGRAGSLSAPVRSLEDSLAELHGAEDTQFTGPDVESDDLAPATPLAMQVGEPLSSFDDSNEGSGSLMERLGQDSPDDMASAGEDDDHLAAKPTAGDDVAGPDYIPAEEQSYAPEEVPEHDAPAPIGFIPLSTTDESLSADETMEVAASEEQAPFSDEVQQPLDGLDATIAQGGDDASLLNDESVADSAAVAERTPDAPDAAKRSEMLNNELADLLSNSPPDQDSEQDGVDPEVTTQFRTEDTDAADEEADSVTEIVNPGDYQAVQDDDDGVGDAHSVGVQSASLAVPVMPEEALAAMRRPFGLAGPIPSLVETPATASLGNESPVVNTEPTLDTTGDVAPDASEPADYVSELIDEALHPVATPILETPAPKFGNGDILKELVGVDEADVASPLDTLAADLAASNARAAAPVDLFSGEDFGQPGDVNGVEVEEPTLDVSEDATVASVDAASDLAEVLPSGILELAPAIGFDQNGGGNNLPAHTLEDTVTHMLRPLMREWLEDNMPRIVENALRIEVEQTVQVSRIGRVIPKDQ